MTTQRNILLSLLALDSYNQGYDWNYKHEKTQIGSARLIETRTSKEEQAAGFSASHYVIGSGETAETVIAFRGTDTLFGADQQWFWQGHEKRGVPAGCARADPLTERPRRSVNGYNACLRNALGRVSKP